MDYLLLEQRPEIFFFCLRPKHYFTKWVFPSTAVQAAMLLGCNRPIQTGITVEHKGVHTLLHFLNLSSVRHPASLGQCGYLFCAAVSYRVSLEPEPILKTV